MTEMTKDEKHICQKCGQGVLDVVDVLPAPERPEQASLLIGCDECRHTEFITIAEGKEKGYLL